MEHSVTKLKIKIILLKNFSLQWNILLNQLSFNFICNRIELT